MISNLRAPLFVPATRPERIAKAEASGTDAIILDLEDSVADADKESARQAIDCDSVAIPIILRVNASDTPYHQADIEAARQLPLAAVKLLLASFALYTEFQ
jgi:citrate lyase subunit beta / citryl-CoA lyase